MQLSKNQTLAVEHGTYSSIKWKFLPPGNASLAPEWVSALCIDWMLHCYNCPEIKIETTIDPMEWEGKKWINEGHCYRAYHDDGRLDQHYHNGELLTIGHRDNPFDHALTTTQQEGYGGANIDIEMKDGSTIILRGPWHTAAPKGYESVSYLNKSDKCRIFCFGLYLSEEVIRGIFAAFAPDIKLVMVGIGSVNSIEPIAPNWSAPKSVVYNNPYDQAESHGPYPTRFEICDTE